MRHMTKWNEKLACTATDTDSEVEMYEGILWTKLSTPLYISKLCG